VSDEELAEVKISLSVRDDSRDGVIDPIVFDNLNQAPP
jgi:hypothetical protein